LIGQISIKNKLWLLRSCISKFFPTNGGWLGGSAGGWVMVIRLKTGVWQNTTGNIFNVVIKAILHFFKFENRVVLIRFQTAAQF
jgi:hypothetical protein